MSDVYISDFSVACALGMDRDAVAAKLFSDAPAQIGDAAELGDGRVVPVGRLPGALEGVEGVTRTNRIVAHCLAPLRDAIAAAKARYGSDRVGVVIGTSTS